MVKKEFNIVGCGVDYNRWSSQKMQKPLTG
jgi:hypothetical protein